MRHLLLLLTILFCIPEAYSQEQSLELIWNLSDDSDSVLVYYHLQTDFEEIDKKIKEYPVRNVIYICPDEVIIDSSISSMSIEKGEFSLIESQPKEELIQVMKDSSFMFANNVPISIPDNFDLTAFMWILPSNCVFIDYSCTSEGTFTVQNNTLMFTAKDANDLQFRINYKEKPRAEPRPFVKNEALVHDLPPVCEEIADTLINTVIYFNTGDWKHSEEDEIEIQQLISSIDSLSDYSIIVKGFTDCQPYNSGKTNWELAAQRASDIVNYLVENGIPESTIEASFSAEKASSANNCNTNNEKMRKVEIILTTPRKPY